jgi:hypothetical protein
MKKLTLNRETLATLVRDEASQVGGAGYISMPTNCNLCVSLPACVTGFCPNSGHVPCSLRTGCCPL